MLVALFDWICTSVRYGLKVKSVKWLVVNVQVPCGVPAVQTIELINPPVTLPDPSLTTKELAFPAPEKGIVPVIYIDIWAVVFKFAPFHVGVNCTNQFDIVMYPESPCKNVCTLESVKSNAPGKVILPNHGFSKYNPVKAVILVTVTVFILFTIHSAVTIGQITSVYITATLGTKLSVVATYHVFNPVLDVKKV